MAAQLRFAKLHLNKPQDFWNNVLWTDQTKVEMFGHNAQQHVWRKLNTIYQHKHLIPTVTGGGLMIWTCSAATGPGHLAVIESTMNSFVFQAILEKCEAICPKAKTWLKLAHQQDNDPKHSSKSTTECLKKKIIEVVKWSSQRPLVYLVLVFVQ